MSEVKPEPVRLPARLEAAGRQEKQSETIISGLGGSQNAPAQPARLSVLPKSSPGLAAASVRLYDETGAGLAANGRRPVSSS
jgi:hypothetical protein